MHARHHILITCPHCGVEGPRGGWDTHIRYCDPEHNAAIFWAKVLKTVGGCWLWQGAKNQNGYGLATYRGKKNLTAHRLTWTLKNGPIPEWLNALHKCDRPACVNPDHLFLGTQLDNARDSIEKGRRPRGERAWNATMSEDTARALRREYKKYSPGRSNLRELCAKYGVSEPAATQVVCGKSWRHIL